MVLRAIAVIGLLVGAGLGGKLDPRQIPSASYVSYGNSSLLASSPSALTPYTANGSPMSYKGSLANSIVVTSVSSSASDISGTMPVPDSNFGGPASTSLSSYVPQNVSSVGEVYSSSSSSTQLPSSPRSQIPAATPDSSTPITVADASSGSNLSPTSTVPPGSLALSATFRASSNASYSSTSSVPLVQHAAEGTSSNVSLNTGTAADLSSLRNVSSVPSTASSRYWPLPVGPATATKSASSSSITSTYFQASNNSSSSAQVSPSYSRLTMNTSTSSTLSSASQTSSSGSAPSQRLPYTNGGTKRPVNPSGVRPSGGVPGSGEGYKGSGTGATAERPRNTSRPIGTAPYYDHPRFPLPTNGSANSSTSCGGTTINIPDATLNWWYTKALDYAAATFAAQYFTVNDSLQGWTLVKATTKFDLASALATTTYEPTITFNTYYNKSVTAYHAYTEPTPDFPSTAVITQIATKPLNVSTGTGRIPTNVTVNPGPASTVLPGPSSVALTALTNTPFVYFTEFAIDSEKPTKVENGSFACATSRQLHTLATPFGFYYGKEDPEGQAVVTGSLPVDFYNELDELQVPLNKLKLGTYAAEPTLLVVVEEVYVAQAVLAAQAESSRTSKSLQGPSFVLPAYSTLSPSPASARIESSDASLLVPTSGHFIQPTGSSPDAHTEVSESSLLVPSPTMGSSVNTQVRAPEVTATLLAADIITFTGAVGQSLITVLAPSNAADAITTTIGGGVVVTAEAVGPHENSPLPNIASGDNGPSSDSNDGGSGSTSEGPGSTSGGSGSSSSDSANSGSENSSSGSDSSSSGSNGGSGTAGDSASSNSGAGDTGNTVPAQQSPDLTNLFSAISQVDSLAGSQAQTSAGAGSGSSSGSSNDGLSGSAVGSPNGGSGTDLNSGQTGSNDDSGSSGASGPNLLPIPVVIGGVQTSVGPSSNLVFGSETLSPGGPAITISKELVSLGPSAVVIGTVTHSFPASPNQQPGFVNPAGSLEAAPAAITIGDAIMTQAPVPVYVVGGQTLEPGRTIKVQNKAIWLDTSGGVFIDGSSISLPAQGSPSTFTAAGEVIDASSALGYGASGIGTLVPGGPAIMVAGTQLSLAPSASALIIDGSVTSNLASKVTPNPLALAVGSDILTANAATQFLLASGNVLTPGGQVTVSGTVITLEPGASIAVINGVTQTLSAPTITPAPCLTIGGDVFEPNLGSTYDIFGQELTPGGVITASGTTISLAADVSSAVINGITKTLDAMSDSRVTPTPSLAAVLRVGTQTIQALDGSTFIISGSTLTPGGIVTLGYGASATTLSLCPPGTGEVVINGVTSTISSVTMPTGSATAHPYLMIAGQVFSAGNSGAYVIYGQTLAPGGSPITFTAQGKIETVSLDSSGSIVTVNGITSNLFGIATTHGPLTIDGQIFSAITGGGGSPSYIVSGQTLTEGGFITFTGDKGPETVSLSPDGSIAVIDGVSSTITPASTITAAPELTVDGQVITAAVGTGTTYLVSGKVLTPGGSVVFDGSNGVETVSLSPDGNTLVEAVSGAGTTSALPTAFGIAQTEAPIITIGSDRFTALPGPGPSYLLTDGQTLYPGGPAITETMAGSVYIVSLSPSATVLVIKDVGSNGAITKTEFETLFPATITRGRGTATIITGLNGAVETSTETQVVASSSTNAVGSASLQGKASLDKSVGWFLTAGAVIVALLAILL